ncbi:MAG: hypothetical protein KDM63_11285, partial [Verrucomicrobiae bacterium]|nr:hypothetical protein [Verrucomicrobiae bacterium]
MDLVADHIANLAPSITLQITSQAKKMIEQGEDICSFGAGEPDLDTPDFIKEAAIEALQSGKTKYTASSGIQPLREAIHEKLLLENNVDVPASQIIDAVGPGGHPRHQRHHLGPRVGPRRT